MAKHTQTIRRQFADELFECDHIVWLALKETSYLTNRHQRVKINNSYNHWKLINYCVPQGWSLGPLLFNILLCDLLFKIGDVGVTSYADDSTPCIHETSPNKLLEKIECASRNVFERLYLSSLAMNTKISVSSFNIENKRSQKLVSVTLDHNLHFHDYVPRVLSVPWTKSSHLCFEAKGN